MKVRYFLYLALLGPSIMFFFSCNQCTSDKNKSDNVQTDSSQDPLAGLNARIIADTNNAELYNERAILYLRQNAINPAFRDIRKAILLQPEESRYFLTLSDLYLMQGNTVKCKEALQRAIKLDPESNEGFLKLAELSLILKEYENTFLYTDKAIFLDRLNPTAYFIRGYAALELGDTLNAIKNYQMAADQDQQHFRSYFQLGLIYSALKNPLAVDYFNNALNINPQSVEVLYALALFYQENNRINKAIEVYNMLLDLDPQNKYGYFNLGYIFLIYEMDLETAINYFNEAITVDPDYFDAYYNRGFAYELADNVEEARLNYRKSLEIKVNYQKAIDGLNRLDKASLKK